MFVISLESALNNNLDDFSCENLIFKLQKVQNSCNNTINITTDKTYLTNKINLMSLGLY